MGNALNVLGTALLLVTAPVVLDAQGLTRADSALVRRILLAEDRRDSADVSLKEGAAHADARVRVLAERARGRITDPKFEARAKLPPLPAPVTWPEPAWRLRYRALAANRNDCGALRDALADSVWAVRLRATDLLAAPCASDSAIVRTLTHWIDQLRVKDVPNAPLVIPWQAGAHALVAMARLRPDSARAQLARLTDDRLVSRLRPAIRQYAVRALAVLADTAALTYVVQRERNDNVAELAIEQLSRLVKHDADALYLESLYRQGAQAVRAAAVALKGSTHPELKLRAADVLGRFRRRRNDSEADVRRALLELLGRPVSEDRTPIRRREFPRDAVALALGRQVTLRVRMNVAAGGKSFTIRLRGDNAPIMAARVLELVERSYYDGLAWHRVEPDFVIQGGSPGSNEYVGYRDYLRDELGTLPHVRGTLGMSTRGHDTGDAQWFVNLKDNLRLNGDYTVWAEVVEGIDVVDSIMEGDRIAQIRVVR